MRRLDKMQAARNAVARAIKQGELVRPACAVCGISRAEAHHPNCDLPLNVEWLCRLHHVRRHAEMRIQPKQIDKLFAFGNRINCRSLGAFWETAKDL